MGGGNGKDRSREEGSVQLAGRCRGFEERCWGQGTPRESRLRGRWSGLLFQPICLSLMKLSSAAY